jgi:leucyl-tRNA synthetase
LFIMFTSPPEQSLEWSDAGVEGAFRFLKRLWVRVASHINEGMVTSYDKTQLTAPQKQMRRRLHETLQKVTDDMSRRYTFNTAIAAVMELMNDLNAFPITSETDKAIRHEVIATVLPMLAPIVPHMTHALWIALGQTGSLMDAPWPLLDTSALVKDSLELVIQVNGKVRGKIEVSVSADKKTIEEAVVQNENVQRYLEGKSITKIIVVPNKLVNVVAQ